jgi:hypothetical protein
MGEINAALGAAGAGVKVEAMGKEWTVLPPTQKCLGAFEAWCEQESMRKLQRMRSVMPAEDFAAAQKEHLDGITAMKYTWGNEACSALLRTVSGMVEFTLLVMRQAHPELTRPELERLLGANKKGFGDALAKAMQLAFPSEGTDPNATAPTTETAAASPA